MSKPFYDPNSNDDATAPSEERLRALVTAIADVTYSMNADWSVMRQVDGRGFIKDNHEPLSDWRVKNIYPADLDKINKGIEDAIREKKIFQMEHRVLRVDGSTGWTFSRAVPILNNNGEIIEWFGAASDITDRKHAELALQQAKEKSEQQRRLYETITSGTPDLMYVFDLDYRFTYANSALLTMWGKTWDNAIGKGLLENGYEPWHAEMHEREIDQVKATKQPIRGEVSFPHATLGKRVYDYIFTPVLNEQGEVEAVAGTTRDVTERKRWEESLARSSEELQATNEEIISSNEELASTNEELIATNDELEQVNQKLREAQQKIEEAEEGTRMAIQSGELATWYLNEKLGTITASPRFNELFGFVPGEQVPYDAAINQIIPQYRQMVQDAVTASFKTGAQFNVEYPVIGFHDSRQRWVRSVGKFVADDRNGNYITGVMADITEQKMDEIRKNDFIGMVSHELKTPLTSLNAIIQVTNAKLKTSDDQFLAGAMDKANVQVKRMTSMINGFLNISRLESGKILIEKTDFNIEELVNQVVEEMKLTVTTHKFSSALCQPLIVHADRDKINSVISNLLSNAVKYSPRNTTVKVACIATKSEVTLSIEDEGMGIKAADTDKIFDRYYRVDNDDTQHISGFGIGLYLSAEIIRRHSGKIWVESEFGKGSKFYFSLPL